MAEKKGAEKGAEVLPTAGSPGGPYPNTKESRSPMPDELRGRPALAKELREGAATAAAERAEMDEVEQAIPVRIVSDKQPAAKRAVKAKSEKVASESKKK